ncbi:hypothetical protein AHAS_Ahas14G0029400 [Arachis hypogaea]
MNTASTSDDPLGLSGAISTLVSNKVRAGNAWPARLAVRVVNDVQVVRYVGLMLPILVASNFLDGLQLLEDAVDKKWVLLSFINLGSYYVIAVPSGIVLAFLLHLEVKPVQEIGCCKNWQHESHVSNHVVTINMAPIIIINVATRVLSIMTAAY